MCERQEGKGQPYVAGQGSGSRGGNAEDRAALLPEREPLLSNVTSFIFYHHQRRAV